MFFLEFPQNLLGSLAFLFCRKKYACPFYKYRDAYVIHVRGVWGALTLSRYIFADDNYYESGVILHEYGHRLQSKLLLFLYIPVIAVPSLLWASKLFDGVRARYHLSYYWFYTEAFANRLSGAELQ